MLILTRQCTGECGCSLGKGTMTESVLQRLCFQSPDRGSLFPGCLHDTWFYEQQQSLWLCLLERGGAQERQVEKICNAMEISMARNAQSVNTQISTLRKVWQGCCQHQSQLIIKLILNVDQFSFKLALGTEPVKCYQGMKVQEVECC